MTDETKQCMLAIEPYIQEQINEHGSDVVVPVLMIIAANMIVDLFGAELEDKAEAAAEFMQETIIGLGGVDD